MRKYVAAMDKIIWFYRGVAVFPFAARLRR
jgi:hypothetical protein